MPQLRPLTQRAIFWFWLPLASMWLIMSAEQPAITALVTRLPDATTNLAAFGLSFSLALIIESPVIMLLTAATALATHRQSYRRLMQFAGVMALTQTALHLVFGLTPLYAYVLREWIGAPEAVIEPSRAAFLWMLPWSAMIAFRRLWEGVMIRYGRPQRVTIVIVVRLAATLIVLMVGLVIGQWPGASVGGLALSVGVTLGAVASYVLARPTLADRFSTGESNERVLTWQRLLAFYTPLALTTLISMVAGPILAFGLSNAPLALLSLAVWPVVNSLLFVGRSFGIAFQEVGVALLENAQSYRALSRFAMGMAVLSSAAFALLALTPGAALWYRAVSGLSPELVQMALLPTAIVAVLPGLTSLVSWQRAVLIHARHTAPISVAVAINVLSLLGLLATFPQFAQVPGAVLAACALVLSQSVECLFLAWQVRRAARRLKIAEPAGVGMAEVSRV